MSSTHGCGDRAPSAAIGLWSMAIEFKGRRQHQHPPTDVTISDRVGVGAATAGKMRRSDIGCSNLPVECSDHVRCTPCVFSFSSHSS